MELGRELRNRREASGYSLGQMAGVVYSTKGHLSKVENGKSRVTRQLAAAYDEILNANGELLAMFDDQPNPRRSRGLVGLPEHTRHFVGRTRELAAVAAALGTHHDVRTCVISGLAGAGKTALAVAAAWRAAPEFRDGCLFFDLRGHGDNAQTTAESAHHLLAALDVAHDLIPGDPDGRANLLRDALRTRQVLLVLDNVRDAHQVRSLLPGAGDSRVIVTSRARLPGLDDAWHVPIDALDTSTGQALFQAVVDGRPEVDGTIAAAIVRQCGHLPLAIRIAAARIVHGGWDPQALLRRLTDTNTLFLALTEGDRSIRTALAVTIDALPTDLADLLGALSLHPGPAMTTSAAQALSGLDPHTTDLLLDQLHEQHLATRTTDHRLLLHDLVQAFVFQRAHPDEESTATMLGRLADHYIAVTTAADRLMEPLRFRPPHAASPTPAPPFDDEHGALEWMRTTWPVLVQMTDLVDGDRCWRLALTARGFFFREKLFEAWMSTHERALAAAAGKASATGMLLNSLGMAHLESGQVEASVDYHLRAHASFAEACDESGATDALASLAWARMYQGASADALPDLITALETYRRANRERNIIITLRGIAFALAALNRHEEARSYATEARLLSSSPIDLMRTLSCLAWVAYRSDDLGTAQALSEEAADLTENDYELARALTSLGNVAARRGSSEDAARWWAAADDHAALNPAVVWEASARHYLS